MSTKSLEQKFYTDVDAITNGNGAAAGDPANSEEYRQLLKLGQALADTDFSEGSNKAAILIKARRTANTSPEGTEMRNRNRLKRPAIMLATLLAAGILSMSFVNPTFAQEWVGKVLQTISLGHIVAYEMEEHPSEYVIPEELKGKLYDADGNPIESLDNVKKGGIFTAEGERIVDFDNGKIVTEAEVEVEDQVQVLTVKEAGKLNEYTAFNVGLPEYLPEGYVFNRGEFYKEGNTVSGKYVNLFFTNEETGDEIYMQQRFADEETAYEMSTANKLEQVQVNGVDAIMMDNRALDWEADGVLYSLSVRNLGKDTLFQIAESIR